MTSPLPTGLIVRGSAVRWLARSPARRIGRILRNLSSPSRRNFISLSHDGREKSCPRARARARASRNLLRGSSPGGFFAAEGSCGFCGSTRGERSLSSAASPTFYNLTLPRQHARYRDYLCHSCPPSALPPAILQHPDGSPSLLRILAYARQSCETSRKRARAPLICGEIIVKR